MGGSSQPSNTTSTVTNQPPDYVEPYAVDMMERGAALSQQPYQPYPGERVADLTDQHIAGLQMTQDRALNGSPVMNAAQWNAIGTLTGQTNPYLDQVIGNTAQDMRNNFETTTRPMMDAAQVQHGAFGNTGLQQQKQAALSDLNRDIGTMSAQMRLGDWQNERSNQMKAMSLAPGLAATDYEDARMMLGAGDVIRDFNQSQLNQGYDQWINEINWPYQQLDVLRNMVLAGAGTGGSSSTVAPNPYQSNPAATMLGAGLMGYGLMNPSANESIWGV